MIDCYCSGNDTIQNSWLSCAKSSVLRGGSDVKAMTIMITCGNI